MNATLEPLVPSAPHALATAWPKFLTVAACAALLATSGLAWGSAVAAWVALALALRTILGVRDVTLSYLLTVVLAMPIPVVGFDGLRAEHVGYFALACVLTVIPLGFAGVTSAVVLVRYRSRELALVGFASAWAGVEVVASRGWEQPLFLAYSQLDAFLPRLAYWGGPAAVSFGLLLGSGAVALLFERRYVAALSVLGGLAFLVMGPIVGVRPLPPAEEIRIGLVQAGVPAEDAVASYATMSEKLESGLDLVVWPEVALGRVLAGMGDLTPPWAPSGDTVLVAGGYRETFSGDLKNSAFAITSNGADEVYDKQRLVPFYERALVPGRGSLRPVSVASQRLGFLICWESLLYPLALERVRDGAEVLVVLANDAWARGSATPRLHANAARLLAIATARPVVFSATTEASAAFRPDGKRVLQLGDRAEVGVASVPVSNDSSTPYVRFGDAGIGGMLWSMTVALLGPWGRRWRFVGRAP